MKRTGVGSVRVPASVAIAMFGALAVAGASGCRFAQAHPAITVGLVTGTIGFGACELSVEKLGTCSLIGAGSGLVLGGITALVTLFADTEDHSLDLEDPVEPVIRVRTRTEPPPGPVDPPPPPPEPTAPPPTSPGPISPPSP